MDVPGFNFKIKQYLFETVVSIIFEENNQLCSEFLSIFDHEIYLEYGLSKNCIKQVLDPPFKIMSNSILLSKLLFPWFNI